MVSLYGLEGLGFGFRVKGLGVGFPMFKGYPCGILEWRICVAERFKFQTCRP